MLQNRFVPLSGVAVLCAGCVTMDFEEMTRQAQASVASGLTACERHLTKGEALAAAVGAEAPEAELRPGGLNFPGYQTSEPTWALPGMVYVASETRGGCTVVAYAGQGLAIRDAALAARLQGDDGWFRIGIVAPQPGDERDALCTLSKTPADKAFGVTMTTSQSSMEARKFIATSLVSAAEQCTSRRL